MTIKDWFLKQLYLPITNYVTDFINNVSHGIVSNSFYVPDVFSHTGVNDKFGQVLKVCNTFIVLSLVVCAIELLLSFDISSSAKLKKIVRDFLISILFINTATFFIKWFTQLSNIFTTMWLPNSSSFSGDFAMAIMTSMGLASGAGALQTMGLFIIGLIIFVTLLLILLMLTHHLVVGLLKVVIIVYPILAALYPLDFGKGLFKRLTSLFGTLLALSPLQALVISLLLDSMSQASSASFGNILNVLAMLILTVLVVPGALLYVIGSASNPKLQ